MAASKAFVRSEVYSSRRFAELVLQIEELGYPTWARELLQALYSRASPLVPPELLLGFELGDLSYGLASLPAEEKAKSFHFFWGANLEALRTAGTSVVPHLVRALEKSEGEHQGHLAEGLDATVAPESEEAVPGLASAANGPDERAQFWALSALSKIGPKAARAVPEIKTALGSVRPDIRAKAARALAAIGPGARSAAGEMAALLEDEDSMVRRWAACALGRMDIDRAGKISFVRIPGKTSARPPP